MSPTDGVNGLHRGPGALHRRIIWNIVGQRGATQAETIRDCLGPLGGVDYQFHVAGQHVVDNVRAAFQDFFGEVDF